jgi:hypothetical protein
MVNIGFSFVGLLGLIDVIFALAVFTVTLILLFQDRPTLRGNKIVFYIAQLVLIPLCLLLAGAMFVFQGWRLDPPLTFAILCLNLVIFFLVLKDFFINFGR